MKHLNDGQRRAVDRARRSREELEDLVLELLDDGCSRRSIATALGMSSSGVQAWADNARRRQGTKK